MKKPYFLALGMALVLFSTACQNTGSSTQSASGSAGSQSTGTQEASAREKGSESQTAQDTGSEGNASPSATQETTQEGYLAGNDKIESDSVIFPSFSSYTIDGDQITDDIFSEADLTVVNIWGTYCQPCILELPDIAKWDEQLPENIQIIGLATDVEGPQDDRHIDFAHKVLDHAKATYTHVIANQDMAEFLQDIYAVPTTIFVNRNKELVGEVIVGAHVDRYKEVVNQLMGTDF